MELVREVMELSESAAGDLLAALIREGYVQKCAECHASPGWEYELTLKGTKLGQASTDKPLPRQLVRLRLHELIERMKRVNLEERFLVGIQEAAVFGEYLTSAKRLRSLDVRYTTYRKIQERAAFARMVERAARDSGRRFSSEIDRRLWPEDEVRSYLQDHSPVYRFSTDTQRVRDDRTPRLVIFCDRAPADDWRAL